MNSAALRAACPVITCSRSRFNINSMAPCCFRIASGEAFGRCWSQYVWYHSRTLLGSHTHVAAALAAKELCHLPSCQFHTCRKKTVEQPATRLLSPMARRAMTSLLWALLGRRTLLAILSVRGHTEHSASALPTPLGVKSSCANSLNAFIRCFMKGEMLIDVSRNHLPKTYDEPAFW